eukprot:2745571-Lingulodinium_polyedra.AAC.1
MPCQCHAHAVFMPCDIFAIRPRSICDPCRDFCTAHFAIRTPIVERRMVADAWSAQIAKCAVPQQ